MEGKKKKKNWNFGEVDLENRDEWLLYSVIFLCYSWLLNSLIPFWSGPLFHVKLSLFEIMRVVNNFCQLMTWIYYSLVCVYNLWVALFWDFGIRSWRNFLLFFIAVIEFEDAVFLLKVADSVISLCLTVE